MNPRKVIRNMAIAALFGALFTSCASQNQGDLTSIPYKPKPDKGLVVIYREHTALMREGWVGRIVNFRHIFDNGQDFGKLSGGTFILDDAAPGPHSFWAKDDDKKVPINVQAGQTYFLRADLRTGMWSPSEVLEIVDFREGAEGIKDLELVKPGE
ncbi:MAG TPA: DUF2846 domain-containing protein [Chthoniobacter sp.]|jgi:hypothetical protein